jgi:hypothetical protein
MSPTSSRNRVPPLAASTRPGRVACAPVKAPFSWPKSSLSNSVSGRLAQSTTTSGRAARALASCSARATSSLPVPDSPSSSTLAVDGATRATCASIARKAGARPVRPCATGCPWVAGSGSIFSTNQRCPAASRSGSSSTLTYSSPCGVWCRCSTRSRCPDTRARAIGQLSPASSQGRS